MLTGRGVGSLDNLQMTNFVVDVVVWSLSRIQLFVTPWTIVRKSPLSMEFSRQEYWSGLPFPPPGDLLDPGSKHGSPPVQVDSLPCEPPGKPYLRLTRPVFPNRDQLDD